MRLGEQQRHLERPAPRGGQPVEGLVDDGSQEVREPSERERGLGARAAVDKHGPAAVLRPTDALLPQQRLADPRLAAEQQPAGTRGEKRVDDGALLLCVRPRGRTPCR